MTSDKEQDLGKLEPVRIHFRTEEDDEKGLFTLMVSGMPVHTLTDNNYIVNRMQIKMLDEKGIEYDKID
jgi:hypothetical protein